MSTAEQVPDEIDQEFVSQQLQDWAASFKIACDDYWHLSCELIQQSAQSTDLHFVVSELVSSCEMTTHTALMVLAKNRLYSVCR